MPELPEVETVRRDLEVELVGRVIAGVDASGVRTFRRYPDVADLAVRTVGRRVTAVERRGKYLVLRLDSSDAIVMHLRMSGQLLLSDAAGPVAAHTHGVFGFDGGLELRFIDPRTFGEIFISATVAGEVPELGHLGVEPLDVGLDVARMRLILGGHRVALKALLLDQRVVVGIGNMYADEILWRARLRYDRRSDLLTRAQVTRLHQSLVETLSDAIAHRGSSLADQQYRDPYGDIGAYQHLHNVYGRQDRPCPRCGAPIRRVRAAGRSTHFCPRCQR